MTLHVVSSSEKILEIIMHDPIDLETLKCTSRLNGGFCDSATRRRVWPKLLGISKYDVVDFRKYVREHRDTQQVICDVERSLWSLNETLNWTSSLRRRRRESLLAIIMATLCRNKKLYYYQGF